MEHDRLDFLPAVELLAKHAGLEIPREATRDKDIKRQKDNLFSILEQLFEEPAVLFKEKINLKLPGGNGFKAHQDAPAFAAFKQIFHITAMISIFKS